MGPCLVGMSVLWPAPVAGAIGLVIAEPLSSLHPAPVAVRRAASLFFGAVAAVATFLIG